MDLIFLLFFVVAGADTLYSQGRRARVLLFIFWSFWLCLFAYALVEIFLLAPLKGINLKDFFALTFAIILCIVGLASLILHKKFPNFWLFYPYVCFFVGIAVSNVWGLFDEVPRNKATYVDDDEIYLWRTLAGLFVAFSLAGLYTLFKRKKLICTLIFVTICLLFLWSSVHFST
ncbi:hypothetical protein [Helicobacter fennelliae]|uniref:hypothetical protein n=1 Tax=Helicobacter fennelliae TaxID=215 RepID=UPI000E209A4A|nr:hypothetical protein [Helicobacter fennelliae]